MLPLAVAVKVVIVEVPPIFNVPLVPLPLVNPPAPVSAVLTVSVAPSLMVYVPVTATEGMVSVPLIVLADPLRVYTPVPALNVPLTVRFPGKVKATLAAVLFHVAPLLTVRSLLKAFVPVAEDMVKIPLVPPPTVVVPVTVKAKPAAVKVVPSPTERFPLMVKPTTVVVDTVPLKVKLPVMAVVPVCRTSVPLPLNVR